MYTKYDFNAPFLITYLFSSLFSLYLVLWQIYVATGYEDRKRLDLYAFFVTGGYKVEEDINDGKMRNSRECTNAMIDDTCLLDDEIRIQEVGDQDLSIAIASSNISNSDNNGDEVDVLPVYMPACILKYTIPIPQNYTHNDVLGVAIILAPIWFSANCCYNIALLETSIGSSTIISNLSGSFALIFSYLFRLDQITYSKIFGLAICFIGVIVVGYRDNDSSSHSLFGDFMALLSAVGYGLYTTVLRLKVPDDSNVSMQLILGYMGVVNSICLFPVIIVELLSSIGDVYLLTGTIFGLIVVIGVFDNVISDYLWARSVLLTSPLVGTVGLSMTIPMALITDKIAGNEDSFNVSSVTGATLVLIGFVVINVGIDRLTKPLVSCIYGTGKHSNLTQNGSSLYNELNSDT